MTFVMLAIGTASSALAAVVPSPSTPSEADPAAGQAGLAAGAAAVSTATASTRGATAYSGQTSMAIT